MENNNIMCAYHAWSFSSEGKLVDVPQAHHSGDPDGNARACASRRGCVATYPVMVSHPLPLSAYACLLMCTGPVTSLLMCELCWSIWELAHSALQNFCLPPGTNTESCQDDCPCPSNTHDNRQIPEGQKVTEGCACCADRTGDALRLA